MKVLFITNQKERNDMTAEEIIADERYHTCERCEWENIPFICRQCKWGEDTRKDLWNLKEDYEEVANEKYQKRIDA